MRGKKFLYVKDLQDFFRIVVVVVVDAILETSGHTSRLTLALNTAIKNICSKNRK